MPNLKDVLSIFTFKNKGRMAQADEFVPTDVFDSRYNDADVLAEHLRTHHGFKDDQFEIRDLGKKIQLKLTRPLTTEEKDEVLTAFRKAKKNRRRHDDD